MSAPTRNDWNSFQSENFDTKVNVLYYYLCEGGYNMQEIAEDILNDYNQHGPQRVSLITRCYGFEGRNGGAFSSMGATMEDVAAFVRKYPRGCEYDRKGTVMYQFLLQRVRARGTERASVNYTYTAVQGTGSAFDNSYVEDYQTFGEPSEIKKRMLLAIAILSAGVLLVGTGVWLNFGFAVSLIIAIAGAIALTVFLNVKVNVEKPFQTEKEVDKALMILHFVVVLLIAVLLFAGIRGLFRLNVILSLIIALVAANFLESVLARKLGWLLDGQ